jgi:hypothetical protein
MGLRDIQIAQIFNKMTVLETYDWGVCQTSHAGRLRVAMKTAGKMGISIESMIGPSG